MFSKKINNIKESGIRKVFSLIEKKDPKKLINLSVGQPHFPARKKIKEDAIKAIRDNYNAYTQTAGTLELRKKIAEKLKTHNNINANEDEILISNGVSGGLFLVFSALFNPEDEIIIPDPFFVSYKQLSDFYSIKAKYLNTYPDFRINPLKLEKIITQKTKAIFLNSPGNPTGVVYSREEIKSIIKVAQKYKLWIISDEIYEVFDYDDKFVSPGSIYKKTITLNGFSKSHSITGWRLGYIHAPSELIKVMSNLQQYTFVCAPSFAQKAISDNISITLDKEVLYYKNNRDLLYKELKDYYEMTKPEGAFYAYLKIPKGKKNFVEELINKNLLVVPGEVFSKNKNYFRISFAVEKEKLLKGIEILKKSV